MASHQQRYRRLRVFAVWICFALAAILLASCSEGQPDKPVSDEAGNRVSTGEREGSSDAASRDRERIEDRRNERLEGFAVIIRDVVQVPASSKERPLARVNFLYHAGDDSGRLFVNDMNGKIYVIKNEKLLPESFLDMTLVRGGAFTSRSLFEQGLSSFAFHPNFAKSESPGFGKVYTTSTETPDSGIADFPRPALPGRPAHHGVLTEWTVDATNPNRVDPASRREVLRIAHPRHDHVMGHLAFNPNSRPSDTDYGMLYIGVGDGGNTANDGGNVDANRNAQDKTKPFGKILRINPLAHGVRKYSIPSDNPFVHDASSLKEIWAYGLRNPQRFSWDTEGDRKMFIADIGQAQIEEINIGRAGANYGWSEREGTFVVDRSNANRLSELPGNDAALGYTYPALQYGHDLGRAVTGGYVYRGRAVSVLRGKYVFGDIASGRIFFADAGKLLSGKPLDYHELRLKYYGRERTLLEILDNDSRVDLRFGIDQGGELYLLTKRDGMIRKLSISVESPGSLSQVGALPNLSKKP